MNAPIATNVPHGYREPDDDEQYRDERFDIELLREHERELSRLSIIDDCAVDCRTPHARTAQRKARKLIERARSILLEQTRD